MPLPGGPVRDTPVKPRAGRSSEYPAKLRPARINAAPRLGVSSGVLGGRSFIRQLGMAVDDRVGSIGVALRIRPGALRITREQGEVIGLRWVVDTMGIREVCTLPL